MCGRFYVDEENERLNSIYKKTKEKFPDETINTGEIYPSSMVPVVNNDLSIIPQKWGIKDKIKEGVNTINSRSESINSKIYIPYFENNRIVIPCSGYYEWDKNKNKYYFVMNDSPVLFLCGISTGKTKEDMFSILTMDAYQNFQIIHNRMPIIVKENEVKAYLNDLEFARHKLKNNANNVVLAK